MNRRKIRGMGWLACILVAVFVILALAKDIDAEESYPSRQSVTHPWGSFTKSVSWNDASHSQDNYGAVLKLNASNVDYGKHQPVDVAVLMSNSAYMFAPPCENPGHQTMKTDTSDSVKQELDERWDDTYGTGIPNITGLSTEEIKGKPVDFFVKEEEVAGTKGYLMPSRIYTPDSGADYAEAFKKRDNWRLVSLQSGSSDSGYSLHFGEKKVLVAELREADSPSGTFELALTGKMGMEKGCNSGSAISMLGAQTFVEKLLEASPESRIAFIPYADKLSGGEVSFSNDKDALLKHAQVAYEVQGGYVNTKAAYEAAKKVIGEDASGRKKAVVFLTDGSIEHDTTREDSVKIAEEFRNQGIETYVMGYKVDDSVSVNKWLKPFAFDYNGNENDEIRYYINTNDSNYGIVDGYEKIAKELTANHLIFTDFISEYFEVDKENAGSGLIVEDVVIAALPDDTTLQRVTAKIPVSEIKSKSAEIKIPIKLKDGYKDSKEYLNTNHIFQDPDNRKGAKVEFMDPKGNTKSLEVDSVYLQPDSSGPPVEVKKAWLHFDLQGGSPPEGSSFESVLMEVGKKISEAPAYQVTPIMEGYDFGGWFMETECINEVGEKPMPAEDTTIYAKWTEKQPSDTEVTLTYKLWGGEPPSENVFQPEVLTKGAKISSAKDFHKIPEKAGSTFEGWYLSTTDQKPVPDTYVLDEDTSIHARWSVEKAKLIYMAQGGKLADGSSLEPELVGIGTNIADAEGYQAELVKEGFAFGGWYMDAEYTTPVGVHRMPEETTMIYARWVVSNTITVNLGGGVMADGSTSITENVPTGTIIKDMEWYNGTPTLDGYEFGGWYQDEECTIPIDGDQPVTGDLKVYAKWEKSIYLYYDLQGGEAPGEGIFSPQSMEPGVLISSARDYNQEPVMDGYKFLGWYLEKECVTPVGKTEMPDKDITIFAKWEKVNMLSYDLQGGTGPGGAAIEPEALAVDVLISSADGYQVTPEKEGFVFGGWYLEKECINPVGDTKMPDQDKVIYAKWTPKKDGSAEDPKDDPKDDPKNDPKDEPKDDPKDKPKDDPKNDNSGNTDQKAAQDPKAKGISIIKSGDFGNELAVIIGVLVISGIIAIGIVIRKKKRK